MQATEFIWFDGRFVPWNEANIHVFSHTLHYGGGAFEGIRCYKTAEGTAIFRLEEHVERLLYSISVLRMPFPYQKEALLEIIKEVPRFNKLEEGYIRPIAFYGYEKMGVNPLGNPVNFVVACWPWGAYLTHECVDIKTSSYTRISPSATKIEAKLCGNYLNGILASLELQGTHYHEALFLDEEGYISEGVGENFFMIKNDVIYTPRLGSILAGITRDTIITLASNMGMDVVQTDITLDEAYEADEAFFTGTAAEVSPIRSINDTILGNGEPGKITKSLRTAYMDLVHGKNNELKHYLTFI